MRSIDTRRSRVQKLYSLRRQIDEEIAQIESEIAAEIAAMKRAKEAARLAEAAVTIPRRREAECGTDGGYYRHRRTLKEDACDACKLAHRVYEAQRKQDREAS